MLIGGIFLGLLLGLLAGGSLANLASIRLRWLGLLLVAIALRFSTDWLLNADVAIVDALRLPLLATAFSMLLVGLWANRDYPGLSLAFVGVLSNTAVIVINGGYMPIYEPSLIAAGFTPADVSSAIHVILPEGLNAAFLLRLGPLGDVIPIPLPLIANVISIGDIFLSAGLAFFLFASVVRTPQELEEETADAARRRAARVASGAPRVAGGETGYSQALTDTAALERPLMLGGTRPGLASPSLESMVEFGEGGTVPLRPDVGVRDRVREHPYVRLALNSSFSGLWAGQLISLFGDRIHQLALGGHGPHGHRVRRSLTALAFLSAALPNLFLSPVAGTFVDRWDKKEVLVVSDILRAAVILLIPVAAVTNILLIYPLSFAVTAISVFFRPARVAILPQDRRGRRAGHRELRALAGRDDRRRRRLHAGRAAGGRTRHRVATGVLAGRRDVPRVRHPDRHAGRRPGRARAGRTGRRGRRAPAASSRRCARAGSSSATRRCSWRTPSRRPSGSSRSASSSP